MIPCTIRDMQKIRSFVAVPLPAPIRKNAAALVGRLSQSGDGVQWVPTDNLHLTLKFLGDVTNTEVPQVCNVLRNVCDSYDPFDLVFSGTGGFPELSRPRVLYVGVEDESDSLRSMVATLETEFAKLGFKPEPRDYRPHLTIGRTRGTSRRIGTEVLERVEAQRQVRLGEMIVDEIHLIASFLDKTGPTYQIMDRIEF
jgi:RNA 2',3'-cyclic 3'-phosphodiesterase